MRAGKRKITGRKSVMPLRARCNADIKEKLAYRHLMPTASLQSFKFVAVKVLGKKLL
jgi:hypothetical protein